MKQYVAQPEMAAQWAQSEGEAGSIMTDGSEIQKDLNQHATAAIPAHAWESTVAIVIAHEGQVHQFGTGILLRIADSSFVVTAGHVVRQASEHGKTLGISSGAGSFVAVAGQFLCSCGHQYGSDEDLFDVAVHRLPDDAVKRLAGKTFLRLTDVDCGEQSRTAVYTLFGFPAVWARPSAADSEVLQLRALQFTTYRFDRHTDALEGFQDRFHLLLDADPNGISNDDGSAAVFRNLDGQDMAFPRGLGGISGCSVWRIGDLRLPPSDWRRFEARNVAVQTGVYSPRRAIKATRWIAVSTLLYDAFPELRPAIELWRLD
ncbi:MAG TPA: hypothetical protein VG055_16600 [Planctomycetaceae bacterium]|nr:hypothetical protein [Planctomycetaceae bacterium]